MQTLTNNQVFGQIFGSLVGDSYQIVDKNCSSDTSPSSSASSSSSNTTNLKDVGFNKVFQKMYNECGIDLKMCIEQSEAIDQISKINTRFSSYIPGRTKILVKTLTGKDITIHVDFFLEYLQNFSNQDSKLRLIEDPKILLRVVRRKFMRDYDI